MSSILRKQKIAEGTFLLEVEAAEIAKKIGAGQFVIIRPRQRTKGICVPVGEIKRNSISVVIKGEQAKEIAKMKKGDRVCAVVGPIGNKASIEEVENVCLISDSYGIPVVYNIAKFYSENKIRTSIVIGEKSKKYIYWEDKLRDVSKNVMVCTEDGSRGVKGDIILHMRDLFADNQYEMAIISGSPFFMREVSNLTRQRIRTKAVVNPMMLDPIGLSGTCRVRVDDKVKFSTIDGPEFNAHSVDFEELKERLGRNFR